MEIVKKMMIRGEAWGSKGQWAQGVRVRPWDLRAECHRVAPFMSTIPSIPCVIVGELPHPIRECDLLVKTWPCTCTRANLLCPMLPPEPPTCPDELKPWLQDLSGTGPASDMGCFSLTVLWSHGLPCCSSDVPIVFLSQGLCTHSSPSQNVLFHMPTWLMCSPLPSNLLKCHFLREASRTTWANEVVLSRSLSLLC